jgi:hypothetical protein
LIVSIVASSRKSRSILREKRSERRGPEAPPKKPRNVAMRRDDPPSEIAQGVVRTLSERNATALRTALDCAVHDVAERFGMGCKVRKGGLAPDAFQLVVDLIPGHPSQHA